ncbi:MAG: ATP-dependent metallopeptidase FtsH/Yme1/Tma family protein [Calditrichaeota bacterium]|nr:MAG: ATP-dependent metallopeptidase FtsH/Yme1/Tma family protein [Calditrichota bacterium]
MNGNRRKTSNKQNNITPRKLNFSLWYIMLAILIIYMINSFFTHKEYQQIPYSQFKKLLREGKIRECVVTPDEIHGIMLVDETGERQVPQKSWKPSSKRSAEKGTRFFKTVRVDDPDLVKELEAQKIKFSGKSGEDWWQSLLFYWILPILILVAIWGFVFRRMNPQSGLMSIGKSKAKIYMEGKTKVTFKDVAGIDEAVEEVKEVVEYLKNPEKFKELGGQIPKGVLLVGPPGTGKTLLAKAVAGEAGVPFFSLSGSDFVEMFVGVGAARVRDLFQQAAQHAPCIVFIDELDALGKARGMNPWGGHDEREQTLNQLLVEMDGFDPNTGVIIMAATNRPEILDLALLRPGRFDRQIVVDRPDINGREAILKVHARKVKLAPDVDLRVIAARTPGFVGADLANVVNEAALLAARRGKKAVTMEDLEEAIDRVVAGLEKKNRVLNKKEKEIVAYHEAGHAIVAGSLTDVDPVHRVSIIPRGVAALGYTLQLPTEDRYLMTRTELINRLKVMLGGRVAEEIIFKEISTGAQNDLERATAIARSMVTEYGMSERLGPLSYAKDKRSMFLPPEFGTGGAYSEKIAAEIDDEIRKIVETAYKEVKDLLLAKKDKLEQLAQLLLDKEVVEGDELKALLQDQVPKDNKRKKTSIKKRKEELAEVK